MWQTRSSVKTMRSCCSAKWQLKRAFSSPGTCVRARVIFPDRARALPVSVVWDSYRRDPAKTVGAVRGRGTPSKNGGGGSRPDRSSCCRDGEEHCERVHRSDTGRNDKRPDDFRRRRRDAELCNVGCRSQLRPESAFFSITPVTVVIID